MQVEMQAKVEAKVEENVVEAAVEARSTGSGGAERATARGELQTGARMRLAGLGTSQERFLVLRLNRERLGAVVDDIFVFLKLWQERREVSVASFLQHLCSNELRSDGRRGTTARQRVHHRVAWARRLCCMPNRMLSSSEHLSSGWLHCWVLHSSGATE